MDSCNIKYKKGDAGITGIYDLLGESSVISLPKFNADTSHEDEPMTTIKHPNLSITTYSDKSFVVRGDYTDEEYDDLMYLKGKYNKNLKGGKGIIFSNVHLENITTYVNTGVVPEKLSSNILHIESYRFVVKGFSSNQRHHLVKLGGKYQIGTGIIFDENNKHAVESYILAENK